MQTLRSWLKEGPFSLALSSGFFGFFAHCGFATALYEAGFVPRKITGSSAGAIVGAGLASGVSPEDLKTKIFSIVRSDFWDPALGFGFNRTRKVEELGKSFFVPTFRETRIPLEVTAFDIFRFKVRYIGDGPVAHAVAASAAVPLLFHPVKIGGRYYCDGGIGDKSALPPGSEHDRVFCHYLPADGPFALYEKMQRLPKLGKDQKMLILNDLPQANPNALEKGKLAFEAGYRRTRTALDQPLTASVLYG